MLWRNKKSKIGFRTNKNNKFNKNKKGNGDDNNSDDDEKSDEATSGYNSYSTKSFRYVGLKI